MKTLLILTLASTTIISAFAQEDTISVTKRGVIVTNKNENTSVTISEDEIISVNENKDTTRIKIGKKAISIVDSPDGTKINIQDLEEQDNEKKPSLKKFEGHWGGIQAGINNYMNTDFSTSLDNAINFMDLNTGRSWTYSINFIQHSFGLGTDKIGIVTGLGIEWSNYNFDRDFSIRKDSTGNIVPYSLASLGSILKNKVQTTYLTIPLLIEFQIPAQKKIIYPVHKNRVYFSAGPVGAIKLGSHSKIVYKNDGDRKKIKDKDDYNFSPLRYGITARAGYKGLNVFATYYFTQLFESQKGPELYPFSVGLSLVDF